MRVLAILTLSLTPAFSQVADIATNADGSTLLFRSQFRLQTETSGGSQQKIYRWQNGVWTRVGIVPVGYGLIPAAIYEPFVVGDGSIYGWQVFPGSGLFPPVPVVARVEVHGAALPQNFPREYLRVSANGLFIVGGTLSLIPQLLQVPQLFDIETGAESSLPAGARMMQVASNGTVAYLQDELGGTTMAVVSIDGSTRRLPVTVPVFAMALSDDARWIVLETSELKGRTLHIVSMASGESIDVANVAVSSRQREYWSLSNNRVLYFSKGDSGEITRLLALDLMERRARVVADSPEPLAEVVQSADGSVAWTVTDTNRLWRFDAAGAHDEILPPLGHAEGSTARGVSVPGSALELRGSFTRSQQVFVDNQPWPISDVNRDGYWFQVPWEWRGSPVYPPQQTLTVRAAGNPFEDVGGLAYDGEYLPYFPRLDNQGTPDGTTVIAAHQDYRGVATQSDPARSGETVHLFMTGLGALDRPVATGEPGPGEVAHPVRPLACSSQRIGSPDRVGISVSNTFYANGMIGIYLVEVAIPQEVPDGVWTVHCGDSPREATGYLFTRP